MHPIEVVGRVLVPQFLAHYGQAEQVVAGLSAQGAGEGGGADRGMGPPRRDVKSPSTHGGGIRMGDVAGFMVALEEPLGKEEADQIAVLISHIKGISVVTGIAEDPGLQLARLQVQVAVAERLRLLAQELVA